MIGYSIFWCDKKGVRDNRFSYIIHNDFKEIENGLLVCHKCDNPGCINPNHLFLGTNQDNETDKVNKNRQAMGSKNGNSNLIEDEVDQIMKLIIDKKYTNKKISEKFNVSASCICRIKKGELFGNGLQIRFYNNIILIEIHYK